MSVPPYRVEPAKTGRSTCVASKETIAKDELRFGSWMSTGGDSGSYKWRKIITITKAVANNVVDKVGGVEKVDGFEELTPAHKKELLSAFASAVGPEAKAKTKADAKAKAKGKAKAKAVADDGPPAKKAKLDDGHDDVTAAAHGAIDLAKAGSWTKLYKLLDSRPELVNVHPEAVDVLIDEYGADLLVCTKSGKSVAEVAKEEGHTSVASSILARTTTSSGSASAASSSAPPDSSMTTVIAKGGVPVDKYFQEANEYHVYQKDGEVWDCMLNQTNVGANNNKFYVIQLLEKDSGTSYCVWNRWGRVGQKGQDSTTNFSNASMAMDAVRKQFRNKTKNFWENRKTAFKPVSGSYTYIEVDYGATDAPASSSAPGANADKANIPDSTLSKEVQHLVSLICDLSMMQQHMVEIGYDAKKMPLGKISKVMIKEGYEALQTIAKELDKKGSPSPVIMQEASSRFYTVIPHNFGFQKMSNFIINTHARLSEKLKMVESLGEIEVAHRLLADAASKADRNPVDVYYEKLKIELTPVAPGSEDWKLVEKYIANTHAATHNKYELRLKTLFDVEKADEAARFKKFEASPNRQLLWHGSRLTNWFGILSQGLRIAPPEAPVTGYMFGKGVYFADMVSKSANYCFTTKEKNTGLMLLAEVALGDMKQLLQSDYHADQLPKGKLSTKGCGKTAPDPTESVTWKGDVVVPCGKAKDVSKEHSGSSLLYNEFIVYDVSQIRTRFLMELEFKYK